jgi:hypothetical protein
LQSTVATPIIVVEKPINAKARVKDKNYIPPDDFNKLRLNLGYEKDNSCFFACDCYMYRICICRPATWSGAHQHRRFTGSFRFDQELEIGRTIMDFYEVRFRDGDR